MTMKKIFCLGLVIVFISCIGLAQDKDVQSMTLDEVINQALKNNLDLQIEMTNPEISRALRNKSAAIFVPTLTADFNFNKKSSPTESALVGQAVQLTNIGNLNLSLAQKLMFGGSVQLSLLNYSKTSNSQDAFLSPFSTSNIKFGLSQPLLKNFGLTATKRNIYIARNNMDISIFTLKQRVIDLIYQTEEAYWNLVYSHQNLAVKEKSLQLAKDLLKQNEIQVKVGVSAPMDILTAQAEVAARESETLQAQSQIQTYEENLRRILNISQMPETIIPQDKPEFSPVDSNFNDFLQTALEKRPDIEQVRLDLKNKNINVRYFRNQLLPDMELSVSYGTEGAGGTPKPKNSQEPYMGRIGGGLDEALREALKNLNRNYYVALQLSVPLFNTSAKADLIQARLNLEQSLLTLKKTESTIYSEVKQIIMDLGTNAKIVEANRISRELADQKLAAEQKKLAVGLSTNYLVLQYQRDFSNTQIAELKSLIDYSLALSRVNKVLGTTLEKHHITFTDFLAKN
jgi:outer membrane protein TolC